MNLLIVDTETGGVDASTDALLSIGAVVANEDLEVQSSIESLINPDPKLLVTEQALKINGLTIPKLQLEGIDERSALVQFGEFARQYCNMRAFPILVGWNIHFDVAFLRAAHKRHELAWLFSFRTLDVQDLWAFANIFQKKDFGYGGMTEASVSILSRRVQHGALADAEMTLDLLRSFVGKDNE